MVRKQGSLALAQEGDRGIVGGQALVFGRKGSGILVDRVEETVGRDSAFAPSKSAVPLVAFRPYLVRLCL